VVGSEWLRGWLTEVEAQRMATSLSLARLNEEEVASLLQQLAEDQASDALLRPLGERLHKETEGNPLFLLETVRDLFERGYLTRNEDGRWRIASEILVDQTASGEAAAVEKGASLPWRLPIPNSVQRVVRQRVSRLCEADRQLLQCAAVIGRPFSFEALRRAAGREMEATLEGVEQLLAADLISAQAHPAAFDFRHDKIREVVYEDLVPTRRQQLHWRVGEALEAIYNVVGAAESDTDPFPNWFRRPSPPATRARAEEQAEELAYHFHQAAALIGPERAARYYTLAGTRARVLSGYAQAVSDLLMAQSLLGGLPPDTARLALWGQIVAQLAPAYLGLGQNEAARAVLRDYIDLCEQHQYGQGIVRSCTLMGQFLEISPNEAGVEALLEMYERAIAVCEARGLADEMVYPASHLAFALVWKAGDLERAESLARTCLTRAGRHPDRLLKQRLYSTLIWTAAKRGDIEGVREAFRGSLAWGGPFEMPLEEVLSQIEESSHQSGHEANFIGLCKEMAAGYARAGLQAPLQQWYLAPAYPALIPANPVIEEDFAREDWHPSLIWQDVSERSRFDCITRPGWLGVWPVENADLWPEGNLNAPRLMATVGAGEARRGDYIAQVRVELGTRGKAFAGLLVWRDAQHFVRLDMRNDSSQRTVVNLQACVASRFRAIGRGQCDPGPMWLRLERVGEVIRGLCSMDSENWLTCGTVRLPAGETEQVGLAAIYREDGAHAWFDSFELWHGTTVEDR
jgi:regulation of enolase protein 1 (concanavalin A-like superfamily)